MNLPLHRLVWALPLVALVAACSGPPGDGNGFDPYPNASTVAIQTNTQPSLTAVSPNRSNVQIQAGGSRVYRVSPSQATHQSVYFLAVADSGFVNITVEDRNADPIASSSFAGVFERGAGALGVARQGSLDAQAIDPDRQTDCAEPCIILANDDLDEARYLVVEATGSADVSVDIYVLSRDLDDLSEFQNDFRSGADSLDHSFFEQAGSNGALETLGDRDWFQVEADGCLTVAPAREIGIWVSVHNPSGGQLDDRQFDLDPNREPVLTQMEVFQDEYVLVTAGEDADEAGAARASRYTLWIDDC